MITESWVKKTLGKKRMEYVLDISVYGGLVDLVLKEEFWFTDSESGTLVFEFDALDKMTKTEAKTYLIDSFFWAKPLGTY
mgnify:CR=1 FL=1|jgi:hypothetical protein|tara:strand:+ start:164 stop:403 length:240 start_codon:yes stop_codon:yes gene_type:complete